MVCPVQHDPTARPTLRLLAELLERWPDPYEKRAITEQRWDDVQPLSRLSHPILVKSRSLSEAEPVANRIIECSRDLRLMKVRASQWRAGVWFDPEGVQWVVAAGLAKGGHRDHEDFYQRLERQCDTERGRKALLPTDEDTRLLKRETAARVLTDWELSVQVLAVDLLAGSLHHGCHRVVVPHPTKTIPLAEVELEFVAGEGIEEFVLSFINNTRQGTHLAYVMERRLLISIAPPEQEWDLAGGIYSAMEESGHCARQIERLRDASKERRLLDSARGHVAHRVHRRHIGDASVDGRAVRSLCGVYFVPLTDPETLPECEECAWRCTHFPVA